MNIDIDVFLCHQSVKSMDAFSHRHGPLSCSTCQCSRALPSILPEPLCSGVMEWDRVPYPNFVKNVRTPRVKETAKIASKNLDVDDDFVITKVVSDLKHTQYQHDKT